MKQTNNVETAVARAAHAVRSKNSTHNVRRLLNKPLLAASAGLLGSLAIMGCSGEFATDELMLSDAELGSVAQPLAIALTQVALPALSASNDRSDPTYMYPAAVGDYMFIDGSRTAINDKGDVMVSPAIASSKPGAANSDRGLRWNVNPPNELKHMGVVSSKMFREYAFFGEPLAMNEKGNMVGRGITCIEGKDNPVRWLGVDMASKNPGVFSTTLMNAAFDDLTLFDDPRFADPVSLKAFCDASAQASVLQELKYQFPGVEVQTGEALSINDQDVIAGYLNAELLGVYGVNSGQVVLEAESYTSIADARLHRWLPTTLTSGRAGMVALTGAEVDNGTINNTGYALVSPRLDFNIEFPAAGTYSVWVLGSGPNDDGDSLHIGLDGAELTSADRLDLPLGAPGWSKTTMDNNAPATVSVGSAGVHTLNVWMREDGVRIDKIILTTNASFTPTGIGPVANNLLRQPELGGKRDVPIKWDAANGAVRLSCTPGSSAPPVAYDCPQDDSNDKMAINNNGQIINQSSSFWDQNNVLFDIASGTSLADVSAQALNDNGLVVGIAGNGDSAWAWSYATQLLTPITPPANCVESYCGTGTTTATAVNNNGVVAGIRAVGGMYFAYAWTAAGGMVNLGQVFSSGEPTVVDINEQGQLVINGSDVHGAGLTFVAVYNASPAARVSPELVPTLQVAHDINNVGQIVGYAGCSGLQCSQIWVAQLPSTATDLINATFDNAASGNWDGFTFSTTAFGPAAPNGQASNSAVGRLSLRLGLNPGSTNPINSAAAYQRSFSLTTATPVTVSFDYTLSMPTHFESNECGEVRVRLGNTYYGSGANQWFERLCGPGNRSGTRTFTTSQLASGSHLLQVGGYLNDNTATDEIAVVTIDNVRVSVP